jgi:hypothetical protein
MTNFQELPPQERGLIIAKLYHNIWYDKDRFATIINLLNEWDVNPIKEAKFLHEIHTEVKENDLLNKN